MVFYQLYHRLENINLFDLDKHATDTNAAVDSFFVKENDGHVAKPDARDHVVNRTIYQMKN